MIHPSQHTNRGKQMYKAAVYVFRDAECMRHGFTMLSRYFKTIKEAQEYCAMFTFAYIVEFN